MFPELAGVLNEAYEAAFDRLADQKTEAVATVSGPVVTRYRSASQNLRTTFDKIIKRAGLVPWSKLFQNLRATRETELMETYPAHVVVAWIGHSETVARKHYLQTTDAHFEKAVISKPADLVASLDTEIGSEHSELVAIQVASETRETVQTDKPVKKKNPAKLNVLRGSADSFASLRDQRITRPGLERVRCTIGETTFSPCCGVEDGAIHHSIEFWGLIHGRCRMNDCHRFSRAIDC